MLRSNISSLGFYVPQNLVTNKIISDKCGLAESWIEEKIGIKTRYFADPSEAASDLSSKAALMAIGDSDVFVDDIDAIIVNSQGHDHLTPPTSCIVQKNIQARNAFCIDINVACPGFIYGLAIADSFIKCGLCKTVLVVGVELHSRGLNLTDKTTAAYFGDGAGAAIVQASDNGLGLMSFDFGADGKKWDTIIVPAGGTRHYPSLETVQAGLHHARMDGKAVLLFAAKIFPKTVRRTLEKAGKNVEEINFLISHQANINIIRSGMKSLGLPMEKTYTNLDRYGNTSSASIPIALKEAMDAGLVKRGNLVSLVSFGAGMAWGACLINL